MRYRVLILAVLLVGLVPSRSDAVTLADIVALSQSGVSDAVLCAVIDADHTVFTLTPQQVYQLQAVGVSDFVILRMLRTPGPAIPQREHHARKVNPPGFGPFIVDAPTPARVTPPPIRTTSEPLRTMPPPARETPPPLR